MEFEILLTAQIGLCVLLLILMKKVVQLKQRIDEIVEAVEGYITFITQEDCEAEDQPVTNNNIVEESGYVQREKRKRLVVNDDSQTQLIQSVLGEFFP